MSSFRQRWLASIPMAILVACFAWCRWQRQQVAVEIPDPPRVVYEPSPPAIVMVDVAPDAAAVAAWPTGLTLPPPPAGPAPPVRRFPITVDGKVGYIEASGAVKIPPSFAAGGSFAEGVAPVSDTRGARFIDEAGADAIPLAPGIEARGFAQGLAAARRGDRWGFIDHTGAFVVPPVFDDAAVFEGGMASVRLAGRSRLMSRADGSEIAPGGFDEVNWLGDGLAPVRVGGKWGYLDTTGALVIRPQFDAAWPFGAGRAPVMIGKRWGYIDRSGALVVPAKYADATHYQNGLASVAIAAGDSRRYASIDATGRLLFSPRFIDDAIWFEASGQFGTVTLAQKDWRPVIVDRTGTIVVNNKRWKEIDDVGPNLFAVTDVDGAKGYITGRGKIVWKPTK